jgi:hypothetical protein
LWCWTHEQTQHPDQMEYLIIPITSSQALQDLSFWTDGNILVTLGHYQHCKVIQ